MGGMREAPQVDGSLVGRMSERQLARFHPRAAGPKSTHWWRTPPPARFKHRLPRFNGVVPEHPPPGLRDRVIRRAPVKGTYGNPLRVSCRGVRLELTDQLLLIAHQPPIAAGVLRWVMGIAILAWHGCESGLPTPQKPLM